jgi:hypothetical protein
MKQGWKFWQWNDRPIDSDEFNGTPIDLLKWVGKWAVPQIPHPAICPTCGQLWP